MSRWQPGQLLFVGFSGLELPPDLAGLISSGRVGGAVLFARNLREPHQIRRLVRDLHRAAPPDVPLVVGIDQEGGRVQRLRTPWTEWPPMRRLGQLSDVDLTGRIAAAIARELSDLGIGLDFAPVVDVDTNPDNPVIGDRSFGREPTVVSRHVGAFIESMQRAGVAACAKHFPGHGDTRADSHLELPRLEHDLDRLHEVELVPFRAAIAADVASMMTAHVLFPRLDRKRPATLSPPVIAILREELGYDGLLFSDDLEMRAVADHFRPRDLVFGCLEAGVDAPLVCSDPTLRDEILVALERSPDAQVERSIARMVAFKERFAPIHAERVRGWQEPLSREPPTYPDHLELVERIARHARS